MARITVCSWRVLRAEPSGCFFWFDPATEFPILESIPPDSDPAAFGASPEVDVGGQMSLLDRVVSVSAVETETELRLNLGKELPF